MCFAFILRYSVVQSNKIVAVVYYNFLAAWNVYFIAFHSVTIVTTVNLQRLLQKNGYMRQTCMAY